MKRGLLSRSSYNRFRNLLTLAIRKSKEKYFQDSFVESSDNMSKMWKIINDFNNKHSAPSPHSLKLDNGTIVYTSSTVATELKKSLKTVCRNSMIHYNLMTFPEIKILSF